MYADRLKIRASSAVQSERKHNLKERRKDKRQETRLICRIIERTGYYIII